MKRAAMAVESVPQKPRVRAAADLPPVIVLNLFHSGLGIARQLAGTGVRVVGLSADPRIYGNFTRLCEVRRAPNSLEEPSQLADFLFQAATELRGAVVFPTRDADVLFLDHFRSDLEPLYQLAIPARDVMFRVIDKAVLAELAIEAGIPIPRTVAVRNAGQLLRGADVVGFPCVVKPVSSIHWRQGSNWKTAGGRKAFRADNLSELRRLYERVSAVRSEILLQEWIPGDATQIFVWGGFLGRESQPLAYFTARKLIQSPAEFGTGCVVESCHVQKLLDPSVRLCRALGYEGMAEIEYKRDPRDGVLKLIEMNVRHWDWHQLGEASQVNLTWVAYCHLTGRVTSPQQASTQHAKWIAEDALLIHALSGLYAGELGPRRLWRHLSGRRTYGIFAWSDPIPFVRYSIATMLPALAKAAFGKIRQASVKQNGVQTIDRSIQ